MLGTAKHPPNVDALQWTLETVWPKLKAEIPAGTELHVYGSGYSSHMRAKMERLGGPTVRVKGFLEDLQALSDYKVMLAPVRYGAGIKGKIADGWR